MFNLDKITNENNKEHNKKWPYISNHSYRTLIIGGYGAGKTNALLNLISPQDDIDKIYKIFTKDLSEPDEFSINRRENPGMKHLNASKAFTECSNTVYDVYEDIDDFNSTRINGYRKSNILLLFITQSYFSVPKEGRVNSIHYLIVKINSKE